MIKNLKDKKVNIHGETFMAETADIIGDVTIGEDSSIWYGAVVRGDVNHIRIGKYTNIQDNATLHVGSESPCEIGDYTTVGHNAIVHGCKVGNNCLIGIGAIVLDDAVIGDNSIVGAGALVTSGTVIPPNSLVVGAPGKVIRTIGEKELKLIKDSAVGYVKLWKDQYI